MMGTKERAFAPIVAVSLEVLAPTDHFYRQLQRTLDLSFVREFVQESLSEEKTSRGASEQEENPAPMPLPTSLSPQAHEELSQQNEAHHDWIEQLGAQDREQTSRGYQRMADLQVSTTDLDATLMQTKNGTDLGYHTHYVVDGSKSRIILNVLVTPAEVMDNQPMLDLLW